MTTDGQKRIREHIETLIAIKESLQEMLDDEVAEWRDTPESIKTRAMFSYHMECLADLRDAIAHIEFSSWDLEHMGLEVEK